MRLARRHRRDRARVRRRQVRRLRRRAVDRADDPVDRRPRAGAGRPARRVGLRAVRAVSPARHDAGTPSASASATPPRARSQRYAPAFASSIVARQVITPLDLERTYGLTGGHIFHGELSLDQFFVTRPLLGWARYGTPIANCFSAARAPIPAPAWTAAPGRMAAKRVLSAARSREGGRLMIHRHANDQFHTRRPRQRIISDRRSDRRRHRGLHANGRGDAPVRARRSASSRCANGWPSGRRSPPTASSPATARSS